MLHKCTFNFERSYAVAGAFDNIISSANVPIEAVFVTPRKVTGKIVAMSKHGIGFFLISVVAVKNANRFSITDIKANLSDFTGFTNSKIIS